MNPDLARRSSRRPALLDEFQKPRPGCRFAVGLPILADQPLLDQHPARRCVRNSDGFGGLVD
jgi:hypothetical protein